MAAIHPGERWGMREIAVELLDIVGPDRVHEVESGTAPDRFVVPEDVAVEFERRLSVRSQPAARETKKRAPGRKITTKEQPGTGGGSESGGERE